MAEVSDEDIRKMAKARVGFKSHLAVYVLVNLMLAGMWFVTRGNAGAGAYYWPVWTHLGWGLGVALHGFFALGPGQGMQAREEARLRERLRQN